MPANLAEIRNSPQFEQLRQVIQTNPQMLQPILQNLAQTNPALLETINQNPDAFLQMLLGGEGGEEVDVMGEGPQPGQVTVSITAEEEAAINRLAGLGFDRNMCLQAFFACDKNEEMAANFLFDSANDF